MAPILSKMAASLYSLSAFNFTMFARTSNGALMGEHLRRLGGHTALEVETKTTELYQLRFNNFVAAHNLQIRHVL
ncbi:hypothetical protein BDU57DRAFT_510089 [Ampelomyces quisqualis]|uniref:Uncharacterized protein n=1 Tax=Ampelomyces quisqualis TaxID=50730 RepID=A0A6A5R5Z2_AMPQU|nr:hypothetical protein BDU57DRAFT_510089 [Ampelomyces quisqualis]